ncbi:MAG: RNA polymerase sigma factor [Nitriliruptorales bacterium]
MNEPDPATVRAAVDGDLDAFEELVHLFQAPIWRFLRGLVGDPTLAEDLTQETFLRAYRNLGGFRFRSKFSTWLFHVARNLGIDELRSRTRRADLVERLRPQPLDHPPGPELRSELAAALGALSPKLREALLLVEVNGLTCREAGAVLDVPEGTVKSRLFHARRQLVAWFGDEKGGDADADRV